MPIYLDHNATTPAKPEVLALVTAVLQECGNASSIHSAGRTARTHIETARVQVANLVAYKPANVIFTSGATEGNNMVLKGHERIVVSAIEHPSVLEARPDAITIPVTSDGVIDLQALEKLLAEHKPNLVSVMAVNSETGVIQPTAEIASLCKKQGALFHCDAVQAAGRIPINLVEWGCDFMTLSAHKMGGVLGAGAVVFKSATPVPRLIHGGGQERRQRAGTENVAAIAGFGMAAECAVKDLADYSRLSILRDLLEQELTSSRTRGSMDPKPSLGCDVVVHGANAPRVPNTSCFSVPHKNAQTMLMQLDLAGVCVSSGSACSSGSIKPSHVLQAMGVSDELNKGTLRVSLGWNTIRAEIDASIAVLQKVIHG